jgi:hypothetical protein
MPTVIPEFVQYQAPLVPLRGVWRNQPPEGDRFTTAEIDWAVTTLGAGGNPKTAVQIDVGGNSPVAFSQIAALAVDNNRCAADVTFLFPDSGFELLVPAYAGGVFPVFTNALMFYVIAPLSAAGDVTTFQVFNTMPPPVAMLQSQAQARAGIIGLIFGDTNPVQIVPAAVSGILEGISIDVATDTVGQIGLILRDGTGTDLWAGNFFTSSVSPDRECVVVGLAPIKLRFFKGVTVVSTRAAPDALCNINLYYSVP